jgi:hypothetical protein
LALRKRLHVVRSASGLADCDAVELRMMYIDAVGCITRGPVAPSTLEAAVAQLALALQAEHGDHSTRHSVGGKSDSFLRNHLVTYCPPRFFGSQSIAAWESSLDLAWAKLGSGESDSGGGQQPTEGGDSRVDMARRDYIASCMACAGYGECLFPAKLIVSSGAQSRQGGGRLSRGCSVVLGVGVEGISVWQARSAPGGLDLASRLESHRFAQLRGWGQCARMASHGVGQVLLLQVLTESENHGVSELEVRYQLDCRQAGSPEGGILAQFCELLQDYTMWLAASRSMSSSVT